jgi:hypothetical protein
VWNPGVELTSTNTHTKQAPPGSDGRKDVHCAPAREGVIRAKGNPIPIRCKHNAARREDDDDQLETIKTLSPDAVSKVSKDHHAEYDAAQCHEVDDEAWVRHQVVVLSVYEAHGRPEDRRGEQ